MKSILVVIGTLAALISSCRTTSPRNKSQFKYSSDCDPRGLLGELQPGGLFAAKRLVYNQVQVQPNVIHPDMVETDETGSLGLFHTYVAKPSAEPVITAMKDIQNQSMVALFQEPKVVDSQTLAFTGSDQFLNIFSVDAMKVLKVNNIKIDVPTGSSAVIIVRGETPAFTYVKLSGTVNFDKLMFILPDATSFQVRGDKFAGTIIAPKASVNMDVKLDGSVFGDSVRSMYVTRPFMYTGCIFSKSHLKK